MKTLALISTVALVLLLAGCAAEQTAPEQPLTGEPAAEPTAEQIQSDLDTAPLDEIDSDLDSLVLE